VQNFGIIGLCRIGMAVALRAALLGLKVTFYDPMRAASLTNRPQNVITPDMF
jgi:phosphoglycerate dehydrogenase-like enzyme